MASRIKHVAIVSQQTQLLSRFYQTLFGLTTAVGTDNERVGRLAPVVSDGYVGLNFNGRSNGRQGGFDHFGIEVDDLDLIQARVREMYPNVHLLQRPTTRPFAGISMHDPAGNVFDLAHQTPGKRKDVYATLGEQQYPRHIDHFMLRTVDAPGVARFYRDVFDLEERPKASDDPNAYLTDGKVTLIVAPWRIEDYAGGSIERPWLDHLCFKVESLDALKADLDQMIENDPSLTPHAFRGDDDVRLALFQTCPRGQFHLADPDGVLLEVTE